MASQAKVRGASTGSKNQVEKYLKRDFDCKGCIFTRRSKLLEFTPVQP